MQSATCWAGWRFSGVLIMGLLGCGAFLAAAQAQDKKEITVKKEPFRAETGDGVKLSGDFYFPETNNRKSLPVVILLHSVGPKKEGASRKDFGKLPELLAKQEYAVLAFDFRGYGKAKR